jgi:hypothetical protein
VPLTPTSREQLGRILCDVHDRRGKAYGAGLGFYSFVRFHIDSRSFRNWGAGSAPEAAACRFEPIVAEAQRPPEMPKDFAPQ